MGHRLVRTGGAENKFQLSCAKIFNRVISSCQLTIRIIKLCRAAFAASMSAENIAANIISLAALLVKSGGIVVS